MGDRSCRCHHESDPSYSTGMHGPFRPANHVLRQITARPMRKWYANRIMSLYHRLYTSNCGASHPKNSPCRTWDSSSHDVCVTLNMPNCHLCCRGIYLLVFCVVATPNLLNTRAGKLSRRLRRGWLLDGCWRGMRPKFVAGIAVNCYKKKSIQTSTGSAFWRLNDRRSDLKTFGAVGCAFLFSHLIPGMPLCSIKWRLSGFSEITQPRCQARKTGAYKAKVVQHKAVMTA